MSWLSLFVLVLAGLVSTLSAIVISAIILLVIGEGALLAYRSLAT